MYRRARCCRKGPIARREISRRPQIESMEERRLMSLITVTGTGDAINATDGVVTLREAITAANSNKNISDVVGVGAYGNDTIDFNIPGTGVHTIRPTSALPTITDPLTIDGYSQPGSAPNTNPVGQGLNGKLLIEIDGENAGDVRFGMIIVEAGNCTVRGLVINRTQGVKIGIDSYGPTIGNNLIEGNYIGTDATGTQQFAPDSDVSTGIVVQTQGNTIGGTTPAARNLISGNAGYGISDNVGSISNIDSRVQGNLIGTDATGTRALGNGGGGVAAAVFGPNMGRIIVGGPEAGAGNLISGNGGVGVSSQNGVVQGNFIGTDVTGKLSIGNSVGVRATGNVLVAQNTIAFNTAAGVAFTDINGVATTGNLITQNSIFSNFGPGIGISSYLNDSPDADGIQNYPTLASVMPSGAGTRVQGTLASKPNSHERLEFFASTERVEDAHDVSNYTMPGTFAEGRTYLGTVDVTTGANGMASFTASLPALPAGAPYVTATATDITDDGSGPRNNTSPFSAVVVLGGPSFVVTNTNDNGLGSLREAIFNANLTAGAQTITFAIPANDPRHFYYRNDLAVGQVSLADIAVTSAMSDAAIADIDPDWPSSWYSIALDHSLPKIFDTTVIDGYSQPGSAPNTLTALGALNTVLKIEIDGAAAPGNGLNLGFFNQSIDAGNSRIDGLAINRFSGDGIDVSTLNGGVVIAGSFIGTDVSGTIDLGNRGSGVYLSFEDNTTIGGAAAGDSNLISGNDTDGIELLEPLGATITGNVFGADRNLVYSIPSTGPAVLFTATPRNGAAAPNARTASIGSLRMAAQIQEPPVNFVNRNYFIGLARSQYVEQIVQKFGEESRKTAEVTFDALSTAINERAAEGAGLVGKLGIQPQDTGEFAMIDIGDDGVTPNDPGDADIGANGPQNYPVLTSATTAAATTVTGTLNSVSNTSFRIELYSNSLGPNYRAGEQSLGTVNVTTDAHGNASFTFPSPVQVPVGQFITALATRLAAGTLAPIETSEFSAGIAVTNATAPPLDTVGPTISNLLAPSQKTKGTPLVLTFSEDLDPARAALVANYRLVTAGRDKKFGTKDDKIIVLRSATYNVATRSVTLLPRKKLAAAVKYRLTVNGTSASGVEDRAGNLLDGDHDGRVSGNYVAIFKLARPKGPHRP
jgi:hypothetical protein